MPSSLILLWLAAVAMSTTLAASIVKCANGGTLLDDGTCLCDVRYEGPSCELEPCLNGGIKNEGICHCPWGWTGDECTTVAHCEHGELMGVECLCHRHWTGGRCDQRICSQGVPTKSGTLCICDVGFMGVFCDTAIDCHRGEVTRSNKCACEDGFAQPYCSACAAGYRMPVNETSCYEVATYDAIVDEQTPNDDDMPWLVPAGIVGAVVLVAIVGGLVATAVLKHKGKTPDAESLS